MKKSEKIIIGSVLIILGVIFALNALEITDINIFFKGWWTLFIIVPSFMGLFQKQERVMSTIFLIIGVVLLLALQDVLSFDMIGKLIFPTILIVIGIAFLFKDTISKKAAEKIKELNKEKLENYTSVFNSKQVNFDNKEFKSANLSTAFGSVDLKLKNATITKDSIVNAKAIFGGVTIVVPTNVNIVVRTTPIFGVTTNKTNVEYNESLPTLYINGITVFGEIDIM